MSAWYPFKVASVFAAVLSAVWMQRRHHPFPRFGPANQVTTMRALLTAAIAAFIGETAQPAFASAVVGTAVLATVLDGVDGQIARRTRMTSVFGARFDMEIDALLILVLAVLAWEYEKAGVWILASGLMRYGFVAAGWILPWMRAPLDPTRRAKIVCALQIGTLVVALLPGIERPASDLVAALGLLALSGSFAADTVRLWQQR